MHTNYRTSTFENLREGVCAGLFESLAPCLFLIFRQLRATFYGASMLPACTKTLTVHLDVWTTTAVNIRFRNGQLDVLCGSKMLIEGPISETQGAFHGDVMCSKHAAAAIVQQ